MGFNLSDYDFSGYATMNDILCTDGRVIKRDAFKAQNGSRIPLLWNHDHQNIDNVIGHADLENRADGVYAYCKFNETENAKIAKETVQHGDITSLSIYANKLKQIGHDVVHGVIRELSLVHAGANDGAQIDYVMCHSDDGEEEAIVYNGNLPITLYHSDEKAEEEQKGDTKVADEQKKPEEGKDKTVEDVINSMNEEQQKVLYALVGAAADGELSDNGNNEGGNEMNHNVFDNDQYETDVISHAAILDDAIKDAKRYGSLKESIIQHADAAGIRDIETLFPEPRELNVPPEFVKRDESWVGNIMSSVKHTPFSRVKTSYAFLDETEARARGYIKGNIKKEIALSLLKRVTTPTTVYVKMKIDRDDVIDITDFDVVEWQKREMRSQLDKELALAMLLGDGRPVSSEDKINEQNIRPVLTDEDFFTIKYTITEGVDYKIKGDSYSENDSVDKGIIRGAIKARKDYKGSGSPTFYTTEDVLTDLLLIEDQNGRQIYESVEKLATALRVSKIVTVPEMESHKDIYGIIVNMNDYTAGADKGGAVNSFDGFDIDYNQMKYLMETRMSGALTKPYSAIVLKKAS